MELPCDRHGSDAKIFSIAPDVSKQYRPTVTSESDTLEGPSQCRLVHVKWFKDHEQRHVKGNADRCVRSPCAQPL